MGNFFCRKTHEIEKKLFDGREAEARSDAIALLRDGFSSELFLNLVAKLLETSKPKKAGRGQASRPPKKWLEIGEAYDLLAARHIVDLEIVMALAERFDVAESTIRRAKTAYRRAGEMHEDAARQALDTK